MTLTELDALIILTTISNLGSTRIRLLIKHFGSPTKVLENADAIAHLPHFGIQIAQDCKNWRSNSTWKKDRDLANKMGASIIPFTSPNYPKHLLSIPDFPVLLYIKGNILPQDNYCISVIGTRNATIYGKEMAEKISKDLSQAGFTVISGLARGIDTAAHIGALQKGRTLAVIGSGLANIYPRENLELAQSIAQNGALISQFSMNTPPDKQNFPQRNSLVSSAMATVLIEAPLVSGARITVEKAMALGRPIFALPGRVDLESFKYNHWLVKSKNANLIENAQDIISHFSNLFHVPQTKDNKSTSSASLNNEEKEFIGKLPAHELSINQIMQITSLPIKQVNVLLMSLLLKKCIREFPGKIYKRET